MDVARFGNWATPDWGTIKSAENYERRFVMTFPNETLPKGRLQKTTALYDRLVAKGARMDQGFGLENALWFADNPEDAHEEPTFNRNRSFDYVAREVQTVREAVGGIEIANFAKHEFKGPAARAFLDNVLAGHVPKKAGRVSLTPVLTEKGKLYGDLTVATLGDEHFMLFGSGAVQEAHRRWFESQLPADGVIYRNVSDDWHGIALSGPKSRALLARITRDDVSNEALKFRDIRQTIVGDVPVLLNRLGFSGELGYEIYCRPQYLIRLAEAIEAAGEDLAIAGTVRAPCYRCAWKKPGGSGRSTTVPILPQQKAVWMPLSIGIKTLSAKRRHWQKKKVARKRNSFSSLLMLMALMFQTTRPF